MHLFRWQERVRRARATRRACDAEDGLSKLGVTENGHFATESGAATARQSSARPTILSAFTGDFGVGVDSTNTASAETRREAAAEHDEDWFINFATRLFEL